MEVHIRKSFHSPTVGLKSSLTHSGNNIFVIIELLSAQYQSESVYSRWSSLL